LPIRIDLETNGQRRDKSNATTARPRFAFVGRIAFQSLFKDMARRSDGVSLDRIGLRPDAGQLIQSYLEPLDLKHQSFSR